MAGAELQEDQSPRRVQNLTLRTLASLTNNGGRCGAAGRSVSEEGADSLIMP